MDVNLTELIYEWILHWVEFRFIPVSSTEGQDAEYTPTKQFGVPN